ncbi:TVP38/TMEM64 family protein [Rubellimicrobium arenae]|uniref:TVP38/TMEM64 family protein n=1 Tax=Rubellimicrobium arenae TaxID=2817372 RepID=UPI001B30F438|nr:VTT domain-containing protein [Rubellimicrobium arenae]
MPRALRWGALAALILLVILGPFALWGGPIEAWVEAGHWSRANPAGPAALLAGLLAADGLLPVPSSLVSMLLGTLLGAVPGTILGTLAMTAGVVLSYLLGRRGGRPVARRLIGEDGIARAAGWLGRNGVWALALCRPLPVLAEASVLMAGLAGLRIGPVLAITGLANLALSAVYAGVGATAGGVGSFLLAVVAAFALPGLALLLAQRLGPSRP